MVVVQGSLAPAGAVIKRSPASPQLLRHTGPAVVFNGHKDLCTRIGDPGLDIRTDSALVLRDAGPVDGLGMPEWGMLPNPK